MAVCSAICDCVRGAMKETENRQAIENLIRRYHNEGDQSVFEQLLKTYEPMLRSLVARYTVNVEACDVDDFRQVADIAFCNALQSYDLTQREVNFGLYAKICVSNALVSYLRSISKAHRGVDLVDVPIDVDGGDNPHTEMVESETFLLMLARIQTLLSPYEYKIWTFYLAGYTAKKIAELLGREHHSIENAVYRIRCKLRQAFGS